MTIPECRIGTSGYQYDHWRGVFYPEDLPKTNWLSFYTRHFDTVEINNTFYRLPGAETFDNWRKRAPRGFCYSLKFSRYGSHVKRLKEPQGSVGLFVDRAKRLRDTLGPILVQLPPNWAVNAERLAMFLEAAPAKYRWAIEFRDSSWLCEEIYTILRTHKVALCIHDMIVDHPRQITADWVYLRFHGNRYCGSYTRKELQAEAKQIKTYLTQGLDVFAYFNNDEQGFAVRNAMELKRYVQQA
jgi:uncharacterized protein YecE (DUF72 family)